MDLAIELNQNGVMTYDLIVVGSGILGLATAFRASREGQRVLVIEAEDRPVHSSIMNFGHACFTGQADELQAIVQRARAGWIEAAEYAGFWAAQSGTWIPAVNELEMQVLREFAEHRGSEQAKLFNRQEVAAAIGNPDLAAVGGAHLPLDMRVNPREVAPMLASKLRADGVEFRWNTRVVSVADGVVGTTRGEFRGQRVIVCPGDQLRHLFPGLAEEHGVRVCTLAMALVERPSTTPSDLALLTGTSLARYDGFTAMPSAANLRADLERREPELVSMVANLMATAVPEGLLIGDSHTYAASPLPFVEEAMSQRLLDSAADYLGLGQPKVLERWQGHYADSPETNLVLQRPDAKTTVLVVTSGIGMTLSFGVAELALRADV